MLYLGIFGIEMKQINGKELNMLNSVLKIYCKDMEYDLKDVEYLNFEFKQKSNLYEIRIKDTRFGLGGEGCFVVNKRYGE